VEEVKAIEGTRKGYRLSGSYSGKLYNESMVTGGGKDVKGSGKDEGAVSGSFSTCVYLRFSREPDYSRAVKLVKGSLTSSHRNIRIAPGELVYISELVSTRASETAELLYPDGTRLFLEENSAIVILDFHEKKRNGTSWFKSAIRVMKGFLNSIVNPLQGALSGEVPESRLDVYTNYGTTGVHGTSFQVSVSQDGDRVKVLEGEVEVTHRKERKTFTLGARWCATLTEKEMSEEQMEVADLERLRESFSRAVDGAPSLPRPAAPPAPAGQAQSIPPTWQMTETLYEPVSGVWRLRPGGAQLDASWANGAQGIITIEKWSPDEVVLTRFDPSGVSAGLTARYVGKRQGSLIRGTVTWYGRDAEFNGTWEAVLK